MKKPAIRQRVGELKRVSNERAITGLSVSKSWMLQNLKENVQEAKAEGNRSAVNRGLELIGKEIGMFVERKELGIRGLRNASAESLVNILTEIDGAIKVEAHELQALPAVEEESNAKDVCAE